MPRNRTWTDEQLREAVAAADSLTEVLRKLGLRTAGGNHANVRRHIERMQLDTSHFDPWARAVAGLGAVARPLDEILVEGSTYQRTKLKQRLYDEGLKERRCEECGQDETWRGRRMSLILDHINGVHNDNRLVNLRIVCPNCAATLETHCGRKNRFALEPRPCGFCGETFHPKSWNNRYCSRYCGMRGPRDRSPKPERRLVERPPFEQLRTEIEALGWSAVGRKYGVSDNAIRKWVRMYERAQEMDDAA